MPFPCTRASTYRPRKVRLSSRRLMGSDTPNWLHNVHAPSSEGHDGLKWDSTAVNISVMIFLVEWLIFFLGHDSLTPI